MQPKLNGRIALFFPQHVPQESDTFQIAPGTQQTITAIGLGPGDYIEFQLLYVPTIDPDNCGCPPGVASMPTVAGYSTLKCCGEPIRLTEDNPVVILDNPQRTLLRAVLHADDTQAIFAWAIETNTQNVNDRMRGCPCAEV